MGDDELARPDPEDGLPAMPVGEWAQEKHALLGFYIEITCEARRKFLERPPKAGATYIDLFCSTGRAYVKGTDKFIDGSPLVAFRSAASSGVPFSELHINDHDAAMMGTAKIRLERLGAPVISYGGDAGEAVVAILKRLNRYALHFAFLDPFKLDLPFDVLRRLSTLKRIDVLIHVSAMDLQRNWAAYSRRAESPLDAFAPGWRDHIDQRQPGEKARSAFIRYWVDQLKALGFSGEVNFELITGRKSQPLYWLVLVAKHEIAMKFWKKAIQMTKTPSLL